MMPGVRHIALQDYAELNEVPIALRAIVNEPDKAPASAGNFPPSFFMVQLTAAGESRVLGGEEGDFLPLIHLHERAAGNGGLIAVAADFRRGTRGDFLPFSTWSLGPNDFVLFEVKYDGYGWTKRVVMPAEALGLVTP